MENNKLKYIGEISESFYNIEKIDSIQESKDNYFLLFDNMSGIIVPKKGENQYCEEAKKIIDEIKKIHQSSLVK